MQKAQEKLGVPSHPPSILQQQQLKGQPLAVKPPQPLTPPNSTLGQGAIDDTSVNTSSGIFGGFFAKKPARRPGVLEGPPPVLKATGSISEREFMEMEVIKALLQSYYDIVKRTIVDMVPKSIMLCLVNYSREEMQRGLLTELYNRDSESAGELLKENEEVAQRRKECRQMIEALRRADEIVSGV